MRTQPIGAWLDELASAAPAPGGGAAAGLTAATGAALVAMVCNLTIGKPRYAAHEETMTAALARATELRAQALWLAEEDARAFAAVTTAYRLPKETDGDRRARTEAIQAALVEAAGVPLRTAEVSAEIIALARRILDGANVNVISDVAVAASSARAALEAAVVNVEVNLAALGAGDQGIASELATYTPALAEAEAIVRDVRDRIAG
jgi:formiminotetrahydrofolate cyclodeaminase